jgi:hypothetical protein
MRTPRKEPDMPKVRGLADSGGYPQETTESQRVNHADAPQDALQRFGTAAHVLALKPLFEGHSGGAFNLGTGNGLSVREILAAIAAETGREVPHVVKPRRSGDPTYLVADPSAARDSALSSLQRLDLHLAPLDHARAVLQRERAAGMF